MNMYGMSDPEIVRELGARLKRKRLLMNLSQEQLAKNTGLNRATISAMENGEPFNVLTFVQVLRALNCLEEINLFLPEPPISPLMLAEMKGKERKRASRHKTDYLSQGGSEW